jgi:hypothetical protein
MPTTTGKKKKKASKGPQLQFGYLTSRYAYRREIKIILDNRTPTTYSTFRETKLYVLQTEFLLYAVFR